MSMAFDSSDTEHMSRALMQALSQLETAELLNRDSESVAKAVLARAIVEAAEQGERTRTSSSLMRSVITRKRARNFAAAACPTTTPQALSNDKSKQIKRFIRSDGRETRNVIHQPRLSRHPIPQWRPSDGERTEEAR
jgi:uncharacterized membrane-anchored protein YjiN (DUF445 family)